jgi:cytochrome c553
MRRTGLKILLISLLAACGQSPETPGFEKVSANPIEHGKRVAVVLGCTGCHGKELTGNDWSEAGFIIQHTANLTVTAAQTSPAQMKEMIVSGRGTGGRELWGMPSHLFTQLADADMDGVLAYLDSVPAKGKAWPAPVMLEGAKKEIANGVFRSSAHEARTMGAKLPPDAGPEHALARYLVRATCAECHGMELRGGVPFPGAPPRPDLRIVSAYDRADFERLLTTGKPLGDRELGLMGEVARGRYSHFTLAERDAIHAYLQQLARIDP